MTLRGEKIKGLALSLCQELRSADSRIWLIGALLVATAARLPALGHQSLWWDEGITYTRIVLPLESVVEDLLQVRDQTPSYYFLMRVWCTIFGTSEFSLRLLSAFCGIVTIPLAYRLGQVGAHKTRGVWAAWLLAVNPFHVWYSREARSYAMAILLVTCAMYYFLLGMRCNQRKHWLALTVVGGLAYATHYVAGAISIIQLSVFVATLGDTYRSLRKWVLAQALSMVPAASWLVLSMLLYGYSGLRRPGIPRPSLLAPVTTLWNFSLGYDGQLTIFAALGLLPSAALIAWRGLRIDSLWQTCILTWLVVPLSLVFVLSHLLGPVYMDRYLGICVVAYVLWLAASLSALPRDSVQIVAGLALLIAMFGSSVGIIRGQRLARPAWRDAVSTVVEEAQGGDRLLVGAGIRVAYYYAADHDVLIEYLDGQSMGAELSQALGRESRVWFLYRDPRVTNSAHIIIQAKRFDPYESGSPEIAKWLSDHGDWIRQEWFLDGLYLALLESDEY